MESDTNIQNKPLTQGNLSELNFDQLMSYFEEVDPNFANKVYRHLLLYMSKTQELDIQSVNQEFYNTLGIKSENVKFDDNRPAPLSDEREMYILNRIITRYAKQLCTELELIDQVNLLIKKTAAKKLIKKAESSDITFEDLRTEIQNFCHLPLGESMLSYSEAVGTRVALIRKIISDQLEFIKIAKKHLLIRDFGEFAPRIIGLKYNQGKIGGKSSGLLVAKKILERAQEKGIKFQDIQIPDSYFIRSDVILEFIDLNNLEEYINIKYSDIDTIRNAYPMIKQTFKSSKFPDEFVGQMRIMLEEIGETPIIVRSSSLLEDRFGAAFSGKYESLFLGNQGPMGNRLKELLNAIAEVYASIVAPDPISYRREKNLLDYQEQMAILIQKVIGKRRGKYFFPDLAGVAFSKNEHRWSERILRDDGMMRLVFGLGTRSVDRTGNDYAKIVPLKLPTLNPTQNIKDIIYYSQKFVDVIDCEQNCFSTVPLPEILQHCGQQIDKLHSYVSIAGDNMLVEPSGVFFNAPIEDQVLTFSKFMKTNFAGQISQMIKLLEEGYECPVDVEFAYDGKIIYLLQCRPQPVGELVEKVTIPANIPRENKIFSANRSVRTGKIEDIKYIVYVAPEQYEKVESYEELLKIGRIIGELNQRLPEKRFILIGPGRWGSKGDIKLGVRITYADINQTAMLIEIARKKGNYIPDVSYGTHFFQDLVESNIYYLPLYPDDKENIFNQGFFEQSHNSLTEIMPQYGNFEKYIKVIELKRIYPEHKFNILLDGENQFALAFIQ